MPPAHKRFSMHRKSTGEPLLQGHIDRNSIQSRLNELRYELKQVDRMIRVLELARDKPSARA